MKGLIGIILILFLPKANNTLGQFIPYRFGLMSVNEGLPSGTANTILQNQISNKFEQFINKKNNPVNLPGNVIQSLLFDSKNNLWIGAWREGKQKFIEIMKTLKELNL